MFNRFLRLSRMSGGLVLAGLLLLAGCESCNTPDEKASAPVTSDEETAAPVVPPTERTLDEQLDPRTLATRYLRYAYQGAMLSSNHPLNDSLSLLMGSPVGGRALTVIDTFFVESVQEKEGGPHTVQVRFPRAVQIKSVTWKTSAPVVDDRRTLRIRDNKIQDAPHVVGWPAFQRHLREVAPEAADSVLTRMSEEIERPLSTAGV